MSVGMAEGVHGNKEMFNAWKLERDMQVTMEECKEGRRKYEEGRDD